MVERDEDANVIDSNASSTNSTTILAPYYFRSTVAKFFTNLFLDDPPDHLRGDIRPRQMQEEKYSQELRRNAVSNPTR